ncbi:MAG: decarboxylating NADP(+)-dependent phosphogluconate dehydrogenase [Phycisphaeraceae bacterium]|nr:decarboxylating NADP(+)-dependent phosphogluconate dehydrogenase [Phycisphaeraceae bacterium]
MATRKRSSDKDPHSDIGLIGLAVMGQNLVLNIADHGFAISVYNRTEARTREFLEQAQAQEPCFGNLRGCYSLEELVASLKRPRKLILLVKSTAKHGHERDAVDLLIDQLLPLLDTGDILVDGGNSNWNCTIRRAGELGQRGIRFIGSGVSGGEVGARFGPSLMPGGDLKAWKSLEPIWTAISAKVDRKSGKPLENYAKGKPITEGEPCAAYIGPDGAGHYVKMVHNGIEYGDMQLICEAYFLMSRLLGMKAGAIGEVFEQWNAGDLDSFLIQITADILKQKDPIKSGKFLVDHVLDTAGQKGTGKWTADSALELGIPASTIAEAVFARCASALKEERVSAARVLRGPKPAFEGEREDLIAAIRDALYCSKICSYAQGFQLMAEAQREYKWKLDFGQIAMIWRGGCIIRARFLQKIKEAYDENPGLANLLLDPYFRKQIQKGQGNWRKIVALSAQNGVPCPAFGSALAYYDMYRSSVLPANLLQAQRDYFGAHTFERTDKPRGKFFHVDWPDPKRPMQSV